MKTKLIQLAKTTLVIGTLTFGSIALAAWTTPPASPTTCPTTTDGCNPPVNVGSNAQAKTGGLRVGAGGAPSVGYILDAIGLVGAQGLTNTGASKLAGNTEIGAPITAAVPSSMLSIGAAELAGTAASPILKTSAGVLGSSTGSILTLASFGFLSTNNSSFGIRAARTASGSTWTQTAIGIGMDVDNTMNINNNFLWFNNGGNVGIATSSPTQKLDVNGYVKGTGFCIGVSCITSWPSGSGTLSGSGTTGTIPKFTGATSIGDSSVMDNGTGVSIGASLGGNAAIELGNSATSGTTPYLDFHYGVSSGGADYNMRIINSSNGQLDVQGGNLRVSGVSVCRQDGTNCPGSGGGAALYMVTSNPSNGYGCAYFTDGGAGPGSYITAAPNASAGVYSGYNWNGLITSHRYCGGSSGGYVWELPMVGHLNP
jgi:hypothetical protein